VQKVDVLKVLLGRAARAHESFAPPSDVVFDHMVNKCVEKGTGFTGCTRNLHGYPEVHVNMTAL
jgi:hypothetical protein